jgi:uncharacterized protein (DUF488 family)
MKTIYTVGFTKKTLQQFVERLRAAGVRSVIDVRLRNRSQLAGWSKYPDIAYVLTAGFGFDYEHRPEFAPTDELLDQYRETTDWPAYETGFKRLLAERGLAQEAVGLLEKEGVCLLCTEPQADRCHRRLVAEYVASRRSDVRVEHL